jgi:hypothetical protein
MKKLLTLLLACLGAGAFAQNTDIRINEFDPDQPGTDTLEFVELYGAPNTALDGLVLVFFNGATDLSYDAYDLNGHSTDSNGFFVIGAPSVPNVDIFLNPNPQGSIQNGTDAIALYLGDFASWPIGSPLSSAALVDALVYSSGDGADDVLTAALAPGEAYLDDAGNSPNSFSRLPDGGTAFSAAAYFIQASTPGYTNVASCLGGAVAVESGVVDQCSDSTYAPLAISTTSLYGDFYVYVLADSANLILESNTTGSFDMNGYGDGNYSVYGVSYTGTLNGNGLNAGTQIDSLSSNDCLSISTNHIAIARQNCQVTGCDAGIVTLDNGLAYVSYCQTDAPGVLNFTHSAAGVADQYHYFLTNSDNQIYQEISGSSFDINSLPIGEYHLYGVSYFGNLMPFTIQPGDLITDVQADGGCAAVSTNFIDIRNIDCVMGDGCSRIIISEYVEGLGTNKAIELYNTTPLPVDLADYDLFVYTNGDTTMIPLDSPQGILAPGATYVVCTAQGDSALIAHANHTTNSMINYNGNDAVVLAYNSEAIDVIGIVGDTVNQWNFGLGSTRDHTLRRKFEITAPTTDWELSAGQWEVYPVNEFGGLGSHSAQACTQQPYISFAETGIQVDEGASTFTIEVNAYNILDQTPILVDMIQGSAMEGIDFTTIFPIEYTFSPGNTQWNIVIELIDDDIEEVTETMTLTLIDTSGQAAFINEFISVAILDNDRSYPFYPIANVTSQNSVGVMDSVDIYCSLGGIVHGINFNPNGLEFTLIDPTDGILVFSPSADLGYTPAEGDSVIVYGRIGQFMGMAEILPDSVQFVDGGHALETPTVVELLTEENESHMIALECVELVDASQWIPNGSGFNVEVSDGVNSTTMRIDLNTDIFNGPAPEGHFTVVGIGAQMDNASPFDAGYLFYPRYIADFSNSVISSFTMPQTIDYSASGATVNFTNESTSGSYAWDFGDGNTSTSTTPQHDYTYAFLSVTPTVTISLATTLDGCTDVASSIVDALLLIGVDEIESTFVLYPNPTENQLHVQTITSASAWTILDASGRKVANGTGMIMGNIVIDVQHLDAGTYFLKLEQSGHQQIKSFVRL